MVFSSLNSTQLDSILSLEHIFNPAAAIVRQVDVSASDIDPFVEFTKNNRQARNFFMDNTAYPGCFDEYFKLVKFYTGIIVNGEITEERNPGVFLFAFTELTMFVNFWQNSKVRL